MDILWTLLAAVFMLAGIIGCFLPVVPGPPLNFIGLLILQLKEEPPFASDHLVLLGILTAVVFLLDYLIPAYGTKKYGGSRWGVIGTFVGLFIGIFFFPPAGIIIGPLLGALIGELASGKSSKLAMRAAMGSFVGFLVGTLLKLALSLVMTYYFFVSIF